MTDRQQYGPAMVTRDLPRGARQPQPGQGSFERGVGNRESGNTTNGGNVGPGGTNRGNSNGNNTNGADNSQRPRDTTPLRSADISGQTAGERDRARLEQERKNQERAAQATPRTFNSYTLRDKDWVKRTFMVTVDEHNPDKGTSSDKHTQWMFHTDAELSYVNTSVGGNFTINTLPQFTIFADIPAGGLKSNTKHGEAAANELGGMGRYYYESIQTWSQKVSFRFGLPEYKGLLTFFTSFYDGGAAILGRTGRANGILYLAPKLIGNIISLPFGTFIFAMEAMRWMANRPATRYYNLKPTMALYWQRVNLIANMLASNMGITADREFTGGIGAELADFRSDNFTRGNSNVNTDVAELYRSMNPYKDDGTHRVMSKYTYDQVKGIYKDLFMEHGGIDVYKVANRVNRMHAKFITQLQQRDLSLNGTIKDKMKNDLSSYLAGYKDDGISLDKYLKLYHEGRLGARTYKKDDGTEYDPLASSPFNYYTNQKYYISSGGDPNDLAIGQDGTIGGSMQGVSSGTANGTNATANANATRVGTNTVLANGQTTGQQNGIGNNNAAIAVNTPGGNRNGNSVIGNGYLPTNSLALGFNGSGMLPGSGVYAPGQGTNQNGGYAQTQRNRIGQVSGQMTGERQSTVATGVSANANRSSNAANTLNNSNSSTTSTSNNSTSATDGNTTTSTDANATTTSSTSGNPTDELEIEKTAGILAHLDADDDFDIWAGFAENEDVQDIDPDNPVLKYIKGWGEEWVKYSEATATGAAEWINFRVDAVKSVSESFQNDTAPSEIQGRVNGASSTAAELRFSLSDMHTGFAPLDAIVNGVRDTFAGVADGLHISGLAALMGAGFVDIPQRWTDSSAQFPSATYTIKCRPAYGHILSRFLNMHFVIACLLAGCLPISYGRQSYGAPFLCEFYAQGKNQSRLAIIESVSITRGEGNLGWTSSGEFLGCDIQFTVKDLSSVMHAPIDSGVEALFSLRWLITDDNSFNDYMAVLSNLSVYEMTYSWEKLKRNLSNYVVVNQNFLSPASISMMLGDSAIGRMVRKITPHDAVSIR